MFDEIKQIDAGALNVGYVDMGCKAMVSVSGYLIGSREANAAPLPPAAELQWWYQFYFATERGRLGYERNRREFAELIWRSASRRSTTNSKPVWLRRRRSGFQRSRSKAMRTVHRIRRRRSTPTCSPGSTRITS